MIMEANKIRNELFAETIELLSVCNEREILSALASTFVRVEEDKLRLISGLTLVLQNQLTLLEFCFLCKYAELSDQSFFDLWQNKEQMNYPVGSFPSYHDVLLSFASLVDTYGNETPPEQLAEKFFSVLCDLDKHQN